jgi:hypothetical protein
MQHHGASQTVNRQLSCALAQDLSSPLGEAIGKVFDNDVSTQHAGGPPRSNGIASTLTAASGPGHA